MYVCNCHGIRERDVHAAVQNGVTKPAEVFRRLGCKAQCARCVCDLRRLLDEGREAFKLAAE